MAAKICKRCGQPWDNWALHLKRVCRRRRPS
jgi:hypothetical protein